MQTPLFSILIANYNNGRYLEECLKSVFNQTYSNWEIILIDDYSHDDISPAIYNKYKCDSKIHIYYNEKNFGCGFTKSKCIELANGEVCGFLDPDDLLVPHAIATLVAAHIKLPNCSLIYSNHFSCSEDMSIKGISNYVGPIPDGKSFLEVAGFQGSNVSQFAAFKRSSYLLTEGIDKHLKRAVDLDLYLKLEEAGRLYYINQPLYMYRQHAGGLSSFDNELRAEYWAWYVKIKAAERRNTNLEDVFEKLYRSRITQIKDRVKSSLEYKLGSFFVRPLRFLRKIF